MPLCERSSANWQRSIFFVSLCGVGVGDCGCVGGGGVGVLKERGREGESVSYDL